MADIVDIVEQVSQRLKEIRKEWLAWSLRQCSTQDRESSQSPGYVSLVTPLKITPCMTSHKIIQGGRVGGKKNKKVHNLWWMLKVKTDAKWHLKLLMPGTRWCVLPN